MQWDSWLCECASVLKCSCACLLKYVEWSFWASDHILWALQWCFNNNFRGKHVLHHCTHTAKKTTEGREGRALLNFMSFLFPDLQCSGLGAWLEMNAALILSGLSLPLSCIQVPAFLHTKSPVSLCLPPSSCPLLFITSCGFFSSSLYYVYAVNFPFLYLCYPLHAPFSYSSYLTVMTAWTHF